MHLEKNHTQLQQDFQEKPVLTHELSLSQMDTIIAILNESQIHTFYITSL